MEHYANKVATSIPFPSLSTSPPPPPAISAAPLSSPSMAPTPTTSLSTLTLVAGATTLLLGLLLPAVPDDFLAATLPPFSSTVDAYLTPPYLFFAVNLIILAVWGLSSGTRREPPREVVAASTSEEPTISWRKEELLHDSDSSCVTSDAEEGPPSPSAWRLERAAEAVKVEEAPPVCTDEMDRRFEAFIRKVNEQMRMQRLE